MLFGQSHKHLRKAFTIDGIDNTQHGGPGRLGIFSPEDVKEIRVVAGAMDAQYRRPLAACVGGPIVHDKAFLF